MSLPSGHSLRVTPDCANMEDPQGKGPDRLCLRSRDLLGGMVSPPQQQKAKAPYSSHLGKLPEGGWDLLISGTCLVHELASLGLGEPGRETCLLRVPQHWV